MTEYKPEEHYHTKGDGSYWVYDGYGIELARVCDICKPHKLRGYRRDVIDGSLYLAEELIDEE